MDVWIVELGIQWEGPVDIQVFARQESADLYAEKLEKEKFDPELPNYYYVNVYPKELRQ